MPKVIATAEIHDKTVFGNNLRKIRIERGWSQSGMARTIGVTQRNVQSWEMGRAWPGTFALFLMGEKFSIRDLRGFVFNPDWSKTDGPENADQDLLKRYGKLQAKEKKAVDVLLGLEH